jgi:hypothetical protein
MSQKKKERKKERGEKNAIYSGHLRLCQQPRAAHALRLDQLRGKMLFYEDFNCMGLECHPDFIELCLEKMIIQNKFTTNHK